jgi:hypothetical protein
MDDGNLIGAIDSRFKQIHISYRLPMQQNGSISAFVKCKCIFVIILKAHVDDIKHK